MLATMPFAVTCGIVLDAASISMPTAAANGMAATSWAVSIAGIVGSHP